MIKIYVIVAVCSALLGFFWSGPVLALAVAIPLILLLVIAPMALSFGFAWIVWRALLK